ncbi:DegV family protein [Lactobacillus agrestimuris]|uniref:DegV family protein n=1 Tax=Lactobacillus agrestimuris TaxID=2941328 RepID=UPI0020448994|nr:DegV family protein [Lactobacillus agrestimuris]
MTVKIITDSGANAFMSSIDGIQQSSVPLTIRAGSLSWLDNGEVDIPKFISALKSTKDRTSTACPSVQDWMNSFAGADEIFVLTITSALSGTYNSAVQAAKIFTETHPDVRIHVFDTRSAGPQIRLLAEDVARMFNNGLNFDQVVETMKYRLRQTDLLFVLENLDNLANNGRINPALARIAHALKLNIVGTANDAGKFEMVGKTRGGKKMFSKLVKNMQETGYRGGRVLIDYVQNREKAEKLKQTILVVYPEAQVSLSECGGLCTYYAEDNGLMIGYEKN